MHLTGRFGSGRFKSYLARFIVLSTIVLSLPASRDVSALIVMAANKVGYACRAGFFNTAARRSVSGMSQGETKSVAVISGDLILKWKHVWSQVAAGLRSPFRQKGPT